MAFPGLASHLIVKKYDAALPGSPLKHAADHALKLYYLQFVFNQAWTPLFFGMKQMGLALFDIGLLDIAVYALTYEAYKVDSRTAYLLVPYAGWVSFATYLNGKSRISSQRLFVSLATKSPFDPAFRELGWEWQKGQP